MSKVGQDIIAGLEDAIAFAEGKRGRGKAHIPAEIDVRRVRRKTAMTQHDFAAFIGVPLGTLRGWEQGRREPDGAARTLLALVDTDPDAVLKILQRVA